MNLMTRALLAAAVVAAPALAENDTGYDPGRNCRSYVLQHLPVPVRCMAQLLGNWSPKPYIDGDLMFRNREEWLLWKDREDYRHWKNHDYAWHTGMAPTPASAPASTPTVAPPPPPQQMTQAGQPAAALYCPGEIRLTLDRAALQGWSGSDGAVVLRLDTPRAEGGTLLCTYGSGRDRVTLSRPAWGRCAVRPDATGFDCLP